MIRPEIKRELEVIVSRLDECDPAESATRTVLLTTIAATETNQEQSLLDHVQFFARSLLRAMTAVRAARNGGSTSC